jgi:hypothetical protein
MEMKVEIAIGEMHRFELRDALLIYRENRRSFITLHTVTAQKEGPPVLGPAQPLTTAFVGDLAESLSGEPQPSRHIVSSQKGIPVSNFRSITSTAVAVVPNSRDRFALRVLVSILLTALNVAVTAIFGGTLYLATANRPVWFAGVSLLFAALFVSLVRVWIVTLRFRPR